MALYVRDPEVDQLVAKVQQLRNTPTKTEAVKNALKKEIAAAKAEVPLIERVRPILERVDRLGPSDPNFDMKKFSDELHDDMYCFLMPRSSSRF
jgi:antitoxin VapB